MTETEGEVPVPEYETDQYLPGSDLSPERLRLLREEFGYIRTYFKTRPDRHWKLQRWLNQAHFGVTYDRYLTRVVSYAAIAWLFGTLLGAVSTVLLVQTGSLSAIDVPTFGAPAELVAFVVSNRVVVAGSVITLLSATIFGVLTWVAAYYYPYLAVDVRRRNMDIMLPHAIVYMYALSFGGMDFADVLREMAETDTYGEVADEFDTVVRDVEVFGNDLFTALRNARNLTPSDQMEEFLDDMLSVLDSGGDMTEFLKQESEKYMENAADEQKIFLETLATLSEIFIVTFVAAPLFLIVTLMMMSFLGAPTISGMYVLVYGLIPAGMLGFLLVVSLLSRPYAEPDHRIEALDGSVRPTGLAELHPDFPAFARLRLRARIREWLRDPLNPFKERPVLVLLFSVPAGVLVTALLVAQGYAEPSVTAAFEKPLPVAVTFFAAPFVVATLPLSAFHEWRRRRQRHIAKRFPDALNLLASANQMGVRLTDGLDMLARNLSGFFADEMRKVRNDIDWNHDARRALLGLAERMNVSQLTRTCKIIAEGSRSTGELHRVLSIAAEDTRHRYRLDRARHRELSSYTAIVIIGFLVYLGVIVIVDNSFLAPLAEQSVSTGATGGVTGPFSVGNVDIEQYHALFLHSALVQAVGTGFITGKLSDDDLFAGLKYSIVLICVTVGVFFLL